MQGLKHLMKRQDIFVRLRYNFIKQLLRDGGVSFTYVKAIENLANPLTKGLTREMIRKTSKGMGLGYFKTQSFSMET